MYEFKISGMTCGSCANRITIALRSIDSDVKVLADVTSKTVRVESAKSQNAISQAIEDAGYAVESLKIK